MILAIVGLLGGILLGSICPISIPVAYAKLFSVALLASFDSVFGGYRAVLEEKFDNTIFISGFFIKEQGYKSVECRMLYR